MRSSLLNNLLAFYSVTIRMYEWWYSIVVTRTVNNCLDFEIFNILELLSMRFDLSGLIFRFLDSIWLCCITIICVSSRKLQILKSFLLPEAQKIAFVSMSLSTWFQFLLSWWSYITGRHSVFCLCLHFWSKYAFFCHPVEKALQNVVFQVQGDSMKYFWGGAGTHLSHDCRWQVRESILSQIFYSKIMTHSFLFWSSDSPGDLLF